MFTNTTISGNYAMGGGLYCSKLTSNAKLFNSILWETLLPRNEPFGSQVWLWDTDSGPGSVNCSVQFWYLRLLAADMFEEYYVDCIEEDPLLLPAA